MGKMTIERLELAEANAFVRAQALIACNWILAANDRLQIIAADIQRGCDEMRALWVRDVVAALKVSKPDPTEPQKPQERFTDGEQPCTNFLRGDADIAALGEGNRRNLHQCPKCEGNRAWCDNCHSDHHDGGWQTCKPGAYAEPSIAD